MRPVTTDEWAPDAPVFLAPMLASQLGISQRPDYREIRSYVRPTGPSSSALTGHNNIGSVTVDGYEITHTLLTRQKGTTALRADVDLSGTS